MVANVRSFVKNLFQKSTTLNCPLAQQSSAHFDGVVTMLEIQNGKAFAPSNRGNFFLMSKV